MLNFYFINKSREYLPTRWGKYHVPSTSWKASFTCLYKLIFVYIYNGQFLTGDKPGVWRYSKTSPYKKVSIPWQNYAKLFQHSEQEFTLNFYAVHYMRQWNHRESTDAKAAHKMLMKLSENI